MKNLQTMIDILKREAKLHKDDVYNYAIPESWNIYGYPAIRKLRDHQILVHPYSYYAYTLEMMFKNHKPKEPANEEWLSHSVIYSFMVRSATAWDHDRDHVIHHDNLYHFSDNGTFLKSIVLLPTLKRMGINTLLLYQPFALGKTQKKHDYSPKEAVIDFTKIDEDLCDPMVKGMNVNKQFAAFMEACHALDMHVILEYCPAVMARDNAYMKQHPNWFYWIHEDDEKNYHAPVCHNLPQNTIPYEYTRKDLYRSDDVMEHIAKFVKAPAIETLRQSHLVTAPAIVDQINANIPADMDTTILRFYDDVSSFVKPDTAPYMLQDTIRTDLYPGKHAINDCFRQLCKNITWFQKNFAIDGIYLAKPYLLPEKLQKDLAKTARRNHASFVMIAEDNTIENSDDWLQKGYDMISGSSGYDETNIEDFKFHSFAYRLKSNSCPLFAASEYADSRRVSSLKEGKRLAVMLTIMNHFLPNGIPFLLNGIESFDVQPAQLSVYGDTRYLESLPKEDMRYRRQAYLDQYYYNYLAYDLSVLPNLLEKISQIRLDYIDAITNIDQCIPVWFDSPKDPGIGFTFIKENKALMVVCNVNVTNSIQLHIHTDNLFPNFTFKFQEIKQIFSSKEPYIQYVSLDALSNIPLEFDPGEVKFIEFE